MAATMAQLRAARDKAEALGKTDYVAVLDKALAAKEQGAAYGDVTGGVEIPEPPPATGAGESFLSKAAEAVPIIGAPYRQLVAKLETAIPALGTSHLERGEVENTPRSYQENLARENALMEQRAQEHPLATGAGEVAGNIAGYAALPGASMASLPAAVATNAGVSALDKAARGGTLPEVAGAGLGGGLGGAAGYGAGKLLIGALGKAADRAARQAAGGTTKTGLQQIRSVARAQGFEAGDLAKALRDEDIVGGFRGLGGVEKGAAAAAESGGKEFGALVKAADESGTGVPMSSVRANLENALEELAPKGIGAEPGAARLAVQTHDALSAMADGETGQLTHADLQDTLAAMSKKANKIRKRLSNPNAPPGEGDDAYLAVYDALRKTQDEGLQASGLGDARALRTRLAMDKVIESTAKNRELQLEGSHGIGLLGMTELAPALGGIALGHPVAGGALLTHALLGKATAPLRANLLTTALSAGQGGARALQAGGVPAILGGEGGAALGSLGGDALSPPQVPEDQLTPEQKKILLVQALRAGAQ